jgi:glutathione S-transferase
MYAPVATRFRTYGVALDAIAGAYVEAIYAWPAFREWQAAALAEPWIIREDEVE